MKLLRRQSNSTGNFSAFLHIVFTAVLPLLLYVLIRLEFVAVAFVLVLLSKWRMLAVKVRHWPANIRANAVDMLVGLSIVVFISLSGSQFMQLTWVAAYTAWLLFIKPQSSTLFVGLQAMIAQTSALMAIFLVWDESGETLLTFSVFLVTYLCARHFLAAFDEAMSRASAYVWSLFCASLTWLCTHWLLYYKVISQPVLIMTVIGYSLASLYYLQHTDRLKTGVKTQFLSLTIAIVLFILVFSDWSGNII